MCYKWIPEAGVFIWLNKLGHVAVIWCYDTLDTLTQGC